MNRRLLCALVLLPFLVTACGTTVPLAQQGTQQQQAGLGPTGEVLESSGPVDPTGATTGGDLVTGTSGAAVLPGSTGGGPVASSSTSTAPSGASSGPAVVAGPRVTAPLTIGISTIDYSELARQFGANLPSSFYEGFERLIAKINVRGGLAGRQVKAVYHTQNGAASDYGNEAQRTCADFTQDHKVDVVLTYIMAQPALAQCLKAKGILQIDNQQFAMSDGQLKTFPNYLNTAGITLERTAKAVIGGAAGAGVIGSKSVLGILVSQCQSDDYTVNSLLPALAKKHRFGLVIERLKCFTGVADLGADTSQIQSAVLKFRQNGVTDVFGLTGSEGFVDGIFAKAADQQKYYPFYLVSSNLFPWSNSGSGQFPQAALDKMRGFGWTPLIDTGDRTVRDTSTSAQSACNALDKTQGDAKQGDPKLYWNAVHFFYAECDQLLLLGKMLEVTGGQTSVPALRSAYGQVAGTFPSAAMYGGKMLARADAPALMQRIAYTQSCRCFLPVGGRVALPS